MLQQQSVKSLVNFQVSRFAEQLLAVVFQLLNGLFLHLKQI